MKTNSAVDFKLLAKRSYLYDKAFYVKKYRRGACNTKIQYILRECRYIASNKLYQRSDFRFPFFLEKTSFDFHDDRFYDDQLS